MGKKNGCRDLLTTYAYHIELTRFNAIEIIEKSTFKGIVKCT